MTKCPVCSKENPDNCKFCSDCGYNFAGTQTGKLNSDTVLESRYVIVKTVGQGGMGAVYLALDTRLNNMPVAIKEMSTRAVGGDLQAAIAGFQKEASLLVGLKHNSLPVIRDFFSHGEDRWYLVMEYIQGDTLKAIANKRGKIPEAEVLDWSWQLCDILSYLHAQNPSIIFRDLKPDNIMLTPEGKIKLIDFGIARHFQRGNTADTAAYGSSGFAPPEQYGENQTDVRSDIYALGATIHYLLTGIDPSKKPFTFEPPNSHAKVSAETEKAIIKALELMPANRPQSVEAFKHLLPQAKLNISNQQENRSSQTRPGDTDMVDNTIHETVTKPLSAFDAQSATVPIAANTEALNVAVPPARPNTAATIPPMVSAPNTSAAASNNKQNGSWILTIILVFLLGIGGTFMYMNSRNEPVNSNQLTEKTDQLDVHESTAANNDNESQNKKTEDAASGLNDNNEDSGAGSDEAKIRDLMAQYEEQMIIAINNNEFSEVEYLLVPGSNLYECQKKLVVSLYNQNIREKLANYTIENIQSTENEGVFRIYVTENTAIKYPDKADFVVKEFHWIYTAETYGSNIGLSNIEKWY